MLLAAAVALGCGDDAKPVAQDAGQADTIVVKFDAAVDSAVQEDAGPACSGFYQPMGCGLEYAQCDSPGENSPDCGGDLDCVDAGLLGLVCLRKCDCTTECPTNSVCLPPSITDYQNQAMAAQIVGSARGHCFWSFCGGANDPTSPFGNGDFNGPCDLGADAFIKPGVTQTRPGTCFPISTQVPEGYIPFGQCLEAGEVARGGSCSFSSDSCTDPGEYDNCVQGAICIGRSGDASGTCAKLCNPGATGFDPAVPGECAAGGGVGYAQYCQDSSDYSLPDDVPDGGVGPEAMFFTHIGFCVDAQGCDLFAEPNDCLGVVTDGGVSATACTPTNAVSSYGLCGAAGSVGAGGVCDSVDLCQADYLCIDEVVEVEDHCRQYCGKGPNDGDLPCTSGEMCESISFDSVLTYGWGVCVPDTREDAGVPPDASPDA